VIVLSLAYGLLDAVPAGTNLLYFAFVNYTTLGYGDVVPLERWQLLAPMTAMNGVLMFGWSTAVRPTGHFHQLSRPCDRPVRCGAACQPYSSIGDEA